MNSWKESLFLSAQKYPDKNVFVDETTNFSYRRLDDITDRIKSIFVDKGVDKYPRVLVILPRGAVSAAILASLLCCEAVGLFLDVKISEDELRTVIDKVRPHAIISSRWLNQPSQGFSQDISALLNSSLPLQLIFLNSLKENEEAPSGLRWLLHTSGSSGEAKAVMISAENLWQRAVTEVADFSLTSQDTIFNCLSFSHDLGLNQVLCTLCVGCTLFIKSRSVTPFLPALQNTGAVGVTATPLVWIDFLKNHSEPVVTNLRYLTISGGALSRSHELQLRRVFPGTKVLKTYGQTETFRTFINDSESADLGRLISGVSIKVTPEGELVHYGNTTMLGYLFQAEQSLKAFDADGGVLTKDLVEVDPAGKFFLKGRSDDVVKRFEQRFHLCEVEGIFKSFASVHEAVAVCIEAPAGDWRQYCLGVFVELKENTKATSEELLQQVQQRVSYFKVPDKVIVLAQLPRTVSQKVDRMQLKQMLKVEVLV